MFDALKTMLTEWLPGDGGTQGSKPLPDKKLCAAALMVHAMAVDGVVRPEEEEKLLQVLESHYELTSEQAMQLAGDAKIAENEAVDLYGFTSDLKNRMDETERMGLVEDLWEMVFADGKLHEMEDNMVWRTAELLGISSDRRMALKRLVRERSPTT